MKTKYLVVARLGFEKDNNTPSDQVWVEMVEFEEEDLAREFMEEYELYRVWAEDKDYEN